MTEFAWWLPVTLTMVGMIVGAAAHYGFNRLSLAHARQNAELIIETARRDAEGILKDAHLTAKDVVLQAREAFEEENLSRRKDLKTLDERITQRENNLERKIGLLDRKEQSIDTKLQAIDAKKTEADHLSREAQDLITRVRDRLQEVSNMSEEAARAQLLEEVETEITSETNTLIRRKQNEAKEQAEKRAREIITHAVERYAADQVHEITTASVHLPSDDMKGRIIGKEGRNIRSLEAVTGMNILIDDTPETVVISGFDPIRREVARQALERLIADGRIHPARIEEVVAQVQEEMDETIRKAGEDAIYELNIRDVAPEVVRTLGRLQFRFSYSQNILQHSKEMAHVMGMMASELGLDEEVAKRCGLFHDIGKALTHEVEGGHATIGADLLRRHGEDPVVVNAVAAHHDDVEMESLYAVLVKAGDAMTAARPGARSETTDIYVKRLKNLEDIARGFRGVENCYAIQAGRELRVIVEPGHINDDETMVMARNISRQIEEQVDYPGQIKVTVIRETRCVEYAR